jgi:hypothetical protein
VGWTALCGTANISCYCSFLEISHINRKRIKQKFGAGLVIEKRSMWGGVESIFYPTTKMMGVVHRPPPSLVYFFFKLKIKGSFLVIVTRGARRRNLITFNSRHFTPNSIQMTDDVNIHSNKKKIEFIIESLDLIGLLWSIPCIQYSSFLYRYKLNCGRKKAWLNG